MVLYGLTSYATVSVCNIYAFFLVCVLDTLVNIIYLLDKNELTIRLDTIQNWTWTEKLNGWSA